MKKYVVFILFSLFVAQCTNPVIDKEEKEQHEIVNEQAPVSREQTYFYESNKVFDYIFEEWKMENVFLFDSLCSWGILKDDMVLNTLYTIDPLFYKEERSSILEDYKIHKYSDLKKMVPYKYHSKFMNEIDSVEYIINNRVAYSSNFDRLMFYPLMFTDNFDKCLMLLIDFKVHYEMGVKSNIIEGTFIYLKKDEGGQWRDVKYISAPQLFNVAIEEGAIKSLSRYRSENISK